MPHPVSIKEAVAIENDVIDCIKVAQKKNRLEAALDIMLEYVSASLCLDMLDDLYDMLSDPEEPLPVPSSPEEWRELWNGLHVTPIKEGGTDS